ncbi:protein kinase [Sphingomonas ginsenosidivorax]|uniref:Protein kinase n=1 Tax=Sphingomonas ginsenosidivorax TaxID=862135 RepID=A0A5C6UB85_9SPHN|nr:protein kinase [Sphingomonas ginsenosidivorax]TXC69944.1 protein kinase [Sphingomonas ginsenosidivorax]
MALLYFDESELRRGNFFEVPDVVHARGGASYELGSWIARGGNGAVYECRNRVTGTELAVKFLMHRGWAVARRFFRETELMDELTHAHVVALVGKGNVQANNARQRLPFIVMERADNNLANVIEARQAPVGPETYIGQFRGLVAGLAAMHKHAIHRDIKPENILVFGDRWSLADYGLCRFMDSRHQDISGDRFVMGPRYWLSPEAQNKRIGNDDDVVRASDVYQLAAVFWYVVTGRHPSGTLTRDDWRGPDWLFEPIFAALQHNIVKRPQDGSAFEAAIDQAVKQA